MQLPSSEAGTRKIRQRGWKESGQLPLMIILMSVAFSIAAWTLVNTYTSVESNLDIRSQDERLQLEQVLMQTVDCGKTLDAVGIANETELDTKCSSVPSTQVPPYVPLVSSNGDLVTDSFDPAGLYGKMGNWAFRASCFRSGSTACLLVHAGKPWDNGSTPGSEEFKKRALLNLTEDWKKLPNAPWPNCCFGPPSCTLTIDRDPLAVNFQGNLTLTSTSGTSATITVQDSPFPITLSEASGTAPVTHSMVGTKTATATVHNPAGSVQCSVTYRVVEPPRCTLSVTSPAAPHVVTLGNSANLGVTWTNSSDPDATPTSVSLVNAIYPPAPEQQDFINTPINVPTLENLTAITAITPPRGRTDSGDLGYRVYYRAYISNGSGGTYCDSPEIQICPLGETVPLFSLEQPTGACTTCDYSDFFYPGGAYSTLQHGFKVTTGQFAPNLVEVFGYYSSTKADYWTSRSQPPSALEGYGSGTGRFFAFPSQTDAPGLIPIALYVRQGGSTNPSYPLDTQQDAVLFPNSSEYDPSFLTSKGYSIRTTQDFFACPTTGMYTPGGSGPGAGNGPSPGPSSPGAGPSSPGAGPSSGPGGGPVAGGPGTGEPPLCPAYIFNNCDDSGSDFIEVSTPTQFLAMRDGEKYRLTANINLNNQGRGLYAASTSNPVGFFLDGNGHTVSNMRLTGRWGTGKNICLKDVTFDNVQFTGAGGLSFFEMPQIRGARNVTIQNSTFTGTSNVGIFASYSGCVSCDSSRADIKLNNVTVTGTGDYVGGLVGRCSMGGAQMNVNLTSSNLIVNGRNYVGGAVGYIQGGGAKVVGGINLTNPRITGSGAFVGGVVGAISGGSATLSGVTINGGRVETTAGQASVGGGIGGAAGDLLGGGATVSDVNINGLTVIGRGNRVGGVAGKVGGGGANVTNTRFSGIVTGRQGDCIGGIAGAIEGGGSIARNVVFTGTVDASYANCVGGITGHVQYCEGCSTTGTIRTDSNSRIIGGIAGRIFWGLTSVANNASIASTGQYVGGISALLAPLADVSNCSSLNTSITGSNCVAGVSPYPTVNGDCAYSGSSPPKFSGCTANNDCCPEYYSHPSP